MSQKSTVKKGNARPLCMGMTDWTNRLLGLLNLSGTSWSYRTVGDGTFSKSAYSGQKISQNLAFKEDRQD